MEEKKPAILIIEDDVDIADMLSAYFRVQGYEAAMANWGEDGVKMCLANCPDLVILDIALPDIDGFEVARQLRSNRRTQSVPIIFLTEKRERSNRLKGLELQADDYITKPFDIQELRLRVRNSLQRVRRGPLTNPVTGVPEGNLVDDHLEMFLKESGWSLLILSLKNLERFREIYGFVASDDLLRAVTLMIQDSIHQNGTPDDFLGHITSTDFVITSKLQELDTLSDRIQNRLQQSFDYFYRDQDRGSDIFQGKHLAIQIHKLQQKQGKFHDLQQLKGELENLCSRPTR